jgi:hypothetical protein
MESLPFQRHFIKTMNPLLYLSAVGAATLGVTLWQQSAINSVNQHIEAMSRQMLALRQSNQTSQDTLAQAREQLARIQTSALLEQNNEAIRQSQLTAALTPQREGWWPAEKPYFYMAKTHLQDVRFRSVRLPIAEINALMTQRAKAINPSIAMVTTSPDERGEGVFCARLLEGGKLNRDMSLLLGLSEGEALQADSIYSEFRQAVRNVEASRVERVNPPEPFGHGLNGQIIARMPVLTDDIAPLTTQLNQQLQQLLGTFRADLLQSQNEDYFAQYMDKLGKTPREFIQKDSLLVIQYMQSGVKPQSSASMPLCEADDYGHLFPPGWDKSK